MLKTVLEVFADPDRFEAPLGEALMRLHASGMEWEAAAEFFRSVLDARMLEFTVTGSLALTEIGVEEYRRLELEQPADRDVA
jgi:hypothetical protein